MRPVFFTCIVLLTAAGSLPATAQSNDPAYCSALAQKYQRYVGDNDVQHRGQQRDSSVDTAIAQCSTNSAVAIPVLERALQNAKVELPPHG